MNLFGRIDGTTIKMLALLGFICLIVLNLASYFDPARGYELSIYDSTPILTWILLIVCIVIGVFIIVHQALSENYKTSKLYVPGLILLLLTRFSVLILPYVRGYYGWQGDHLSHIGAAEQILLTGHISSADFYPITHIIISEISLITSLISNLGISMIAVYYTSYLSLLFVIFTYLLAYVLIHDKKIQLLTFAVIGCVIFNDFEVFLRPNGWSLLLLPMILYVYYKNINFIVLFLLLLAYSFFHPLSALLLIIIFLAIFAWNYGIKHMDKKACGNEKSLIGATLFTAIILITWILSFSIFQPNIRNIYDEMTSLDTTGVVSDMGQTLDKIHVTAQDFIRLTIFMYGEDLIFIILGIIAGVFILCQYKKLFKYYKIEDLYLRRLSAIYIVFILFGFLYFSYLFGILPGMQNIGGERIERFLLMLTPFLVAYTLYSVYHVLNKKQIIGILMISIIVISSVISIFGLYTSPIITMPTKSVTFSNIYCAKWLIDMKNPDIGASNIMNSIYRFTDCLYGTEFSSARYDLNHPTQIPDHFNYNIDNNLPYGESINDDTYMMITEYDKIVYTSVWKIVGRFTDNDFYLINIDKTIYKLYDNGEDDIYYARSMGVKSSGS